MSSILSSSRSRPANHGFSAFLKSGHAPTLYASFFYFAFSCCIWVLNGAMAPYISEAFQLSPAQKSLMVSVPIIAGALMRFPLGLLSQYIGRKNATLVEMGLISVVMLFGFFFVNDFNDLLAMGVLLGIAGASFGVALSLGSGSFPPKHKGLAGGSLVANTLLIILCFAALGAGNGALFQLVPLRWPLSTAVAGSMIGEIGALGGGLVPNAIGLSKQYTGTYMWGFVFFAVLAVAMLGMLRAMQLRWTRTWVEKGGRARGWRI